MTSCFCRFWTSAITPWKINGWNIKITQFSKENHMKLPLLIEPVSPEGSASCRIFPKNPGKSPSFWHQKQKTHDDPALPWSKTLKFSSVPLEVKLAIIKWKVSTMLVGGFNQPIWKICSSNWIISPRGENKQIFETTTQDGSVDEINHYSTRIVFNGKNHERPFIVCPLPRGGSLFRNSLLVMTSSEFRITIYMEVFKRRAP